MTVPLPAALRSLICCGPCQWHGDFELARNSIAGRSHGACDSPIAAASPLPIGVNTVTHPSSERAHVVILWRAATSSKKSVMAAEAESICCMCGAALGERAQAKEGAKAAAFAPAELHRLNLLRKSSLCTRRAANH